MFLTLIIVSNFLSFEVTLRHPDPYVAFDLMVVECLFKEIPRHAQDRYRQNDPQSKGSCGLKEVVHLLTISRRIVS